jgi:outer membrane protein assembly factor BamD
MTFSVTTPLVRVSLVMLAAAMAACASSGTYTPKEASNNVSFFEAALKAEKSQNWSKAAKGFEQLTFQLPARDPALPLAYYYLGVAHQHSGEYILAAQAFSRVPENFPEDTMASLATYQAGVSYAKLWRSPGLDSDYGTTALSTFQSFLAAYPDSPLRDSAAAAIDRLNEMFARKNLETADLYSKQKAFDSSIIYYKDILARYPQTKTAKQAMMGLIKAYRAISYVDDANETCTALRDKYGKDRDVQHLCPVKAAAPPAPAKPVQAVPAPVPATNPPAKP